LDPTSVCLYEIDKKTGEFRLDRLKNLIPKLGIMSEEMAKMT
jgi:hypothetical protein